MYFGNHAEAFPSLFRPTFQAVQALAVLGTSCCHGRSCELRSPFCFCWFCAPMNNLFLITICQWKCKKRCDQSISPQRHMVSNTCCSIKEKLTISEDLLFYHQLQLVILKSAHCTHHVLQLCKLKLLIALAIGCSCAD